MTQKTKKYHYAWLILITCCMMQGSGLGLISNCAGVFYSPVSQDLGVELGRFSFYRTLATMSQALVIPFVAKAFRKYDVRMLVTTATIVMGGSNIMMSTFHELWQFYLFGTLQGCAAAFIGMIPSPILLGNWFYKSTGTAVGISAACAGLVGMLGSSALGTLIPMLGWRTCYMIIGTAMIALILPFSIFILRYKPEDLGMLPYGADESYVPIKPSKGAAKKESLGHFIKQPLFLISLTAYTCSVISSFLNQYLPSIGQYIGMGLATAATLTSLALFTNMTTKLFLGKLCDSFGTIKMFLLSTLIALLGHILIFIGLTPTLTAGSFIYGITMPLSTVMMPLFCRLFWAGDTYASGYSYVSMFGLLISAPFITVFGTMYDMTGNYSMTILTSTAAILIVLIMVMISMPIIRKESPYIILGRIFFMPLISCGPRTASYQQSPVQNTQQIMQGYTVRMSSDHSPDFLRDHK